MIMEPAAERILGIDPFWMLSPLRARPSTRQGKARRLGDPRAWRPEMPPGLKMLVVMVGRVAALCLVRHFRHKPHIRRVAPTRNEGWGHSPTRSRAVAPSPHGPGPGTTAPAGRSSCTRTKGMRRSTGAELVTSNVRSFAM